MRAGCIIDEMAITGAGLGGEQGEEEEEEARQMLAQLHSVSRTAPRRPTRRPARSLVIVYGSHLLGFTYWSLILVSIM